MGRILFRLCQCTKKDNGIEVWDNDVHKIIPFERVRRFYVHPYLVIYNPFYVQPEKEI